MISQFTFLAPLLFYLFFGTLPQATLAPSIGNIANKDTLVLYHTNDTHNTFAGINAQGRVCLSFAEDCVGGAAPLASVLEQAKKENALILDAGDRFQGSLFFAALKEEGVNSVFTPLPYDALALGNHEFDNGCELLARHIKAMDAAGVPTLAANIIPGQNCALQGLIKPYTLVEKEGRVYAIVGLTTQETVTSSSPCKDMQFTLPAEGLAKAMDTLKQDNAQYDTLILLTHIGYEEDIALAQASTDVSLIVGGHSHTFLASQTMGAYEPKGPYPTLTSNTAGNPVLIVTAMNGMQFVGNLSIRFSQEGLPEKIQGSPLFLDVTWPENAAMKAIVADMIQKVQHYTKNTVGKMEIEGLPNAPDSCFSADCLTGMVIADAFLEYGEPYGAQIAFVNAGGVRNPLPQGNVTKGDIINSMPFGNTMAITTISGVDLLAVLSQSLDALENNKGRGFLQVAGLRIEHDSTKPQGEHLVAAYLTPRVTAGTAPASAPSAQEQQIVPENTYTLITYSFLYHGGDKYSLLGKNPLTPTDSPALIDADVVTQYFQKHSPINVMQNPKRYIQK